MTDTIPFCGMYVPFVECYAETQGMAGYGVPRGSPEHTHTLKHSAFLDVEAPPNLPCREPFPCS